MKSKEIIDRVIKTVTENPQRYLIAGGVSLLVALCIFVAASVKLGDWYSNRQLEKVTSAANANIAKANQERDEARQDQAAANARVTDLENQLATVEANAGASETRLTAARKSTQEVKTKYEAIKKTTTVNDTRTSSAKREELRSRYASRGIIVTER